MSEKSAVEDEKHYTRAPKLLGDFGEGLVTYTLIRKGYEVANVDHVGADLIAVKGTRRFAVSVKTRMYKKGSKETRGSVIATDHIKKLDDFAKRFGLESIFAHAVCIADDKIIHLFMLNVANLAKLDKVDHGHRLRFSPKHLQKTVDLPFIDYSCWSEENIGTNEF